MRFEAHVVLHAMSLPQKKHTVWDSNCMKFCGREDPPAVAVVESLGPGVESEWEWTARKNKGAFPSGENILDLYQKLSFAISNVWDLLYVKVMYP